MGAHTYSKLLTLQQGWITSLILKYSFFTYDNKFSRKNKTKHTVKKNAVFHLVLTQDVSGVTWQTLTSG